MSNLIITIISIALVAITALVGIFYGGTAFSNYQLNVMANKWVEGINQIVTAGAIWRADNGVNNICTSVGSSAYSNGGMCRTDAFLYGWGGPDKGKYVWPLAWMDGKLTPYVASNFDTQGDGYTTYNNVTYHLNAQFYTNSQGDYYRLVIFKGSGIGAGDQVSPDPTDDFVKVCQKINSKASIPPSVTIDPTYNLPITTGTDSIYAWGGNMVNNEIGPGICYLQKYGNSTTALIYYKRL